MIDITSGHPQPGNVIGATAGDAGPGEWKPAAPGDVPGVLLERRHLHHHHHQARSMFSSHEALRFCAQKGVGLVELTL